MSCVALPAGSNCCFLFRSACSTSHSHMSSGSNFPFSVLLEQVFLSAHRTFPFFPNVRHHPAALEADCRAGLQLRLPQRDKMAGRRVAEPWVSMKQVEGLIRSSAQVRLLMFSPTEKRRFPVLHPDVIRKL